MKVRRAGAGDAGAVQALYRELVPGDPNIDVASEQLAALEADPHNHLLVVELEGVVCGSAFLTLCRDPMYGSQPYGVIENVIVSSQRRGRGAGRALLSEVEAIARAARCTKLMLLSAVTRSGAHAVFGHLGFDGNRKRGFVKYLNRAR